MAPWQCALTRPGRSRIDPAGGLGLRLGKITDQCDYKATNKGNLLRHPKSKHDGVEFLFLIEFLQLNCNVQPLGQCDHLFMNFYNCFAKLIPLQKVAQPEETQKLDT